jgi:hypothetical protein
MRVLAAEVQHLAGKEGVSDEGPLDLTHLGGKLVIFPANIRHTLENSWMPALCAQAAADPEAYSRHFQLVEQHPELRARDAMKMQQIADKLGDLLIHRGSDEATALFAGQVALACYQTARRLGNNPHTLVDETRAAFRRVLTLGTGTAETRGD